MKREYHDVHIAAKLANSKGEKVRKLAFPERLSNTDIINEAIDWWIERKENSTSKSEQKTWQTEQNSLDEILGNLSVEEADDIVYNQIVKPHERKKKLAADQGGYRYIRKSTRLHEIKSIQKAQEIKELTRAKAEA